MLRSHIYKFPCSLKLIHNSKLICAIVMCEGGVENMGQMHGSS